MNDRLTLLDVLDDLDLACDLHDHIVAGNAHDEDGEKCVRAFHRARLHLLTILSRPEEGPGPQGPGPEGIATEPAAPPPRLPRLEIPCVGGPVAGAVLPFAEMDSRCWLGYAADGQRNVSATFGGESPAMPPGTQLRGYYAPLVIENDAEGRARLVAYWHDVAPLADAPADGPEEP